MLTQRLRGQRKDILTMRGEVSDMLPSRRGEALKLLKVTTQKTVAFVKTEITTYEQRQRDTVDHPGRELDAGLRIRNFQLLRIVLSIVSACLQVVITKASLDFTWTASVFAGVSLALALSAIVETAAVWLSHRVNMPKRSIRIALAFAKWTGAFVVAAIAILLTTRVASVEIVAQLHLGELGNLSLFIVAEGAAIVAGCLAAAARWLMYPQVIDEMLLDLAEMHAWLNEYSPPGDVTGEPSVIIPNSPRFNGVGAALLLCLLSVPVSSAIAQKSAAMPQLATAATGVAGSDSVRTGLMEPDCLIAIDVTSSLSPTGLSGALNLMGSMMEEFVDAGRCRALSLVHFTDGGLDWPLREPWHVAISAESSLTDCIHSELKSRQRKGMVIDQVPAVAKADSNKAKEVCRKRDAIRRESVRAILQVLRDSLAPKTLVSDGRSGVKRILRDAIRAGYTNAVIITDGRDNMKEADETVPVPTGRQMTLLLVEPRPGLARASDADIARYQRLFPGLRVRTRMQLAPGFWRATESALATRSDRK